MSNMKRNLLTAEAEIEVDKSSDDEEEELQRASHPKTASKYNWSGREAVLMTQRPGETPPQLPLRTKLLSIYSIISSTINSSEDIRSRNYHSHQDVDCLRS
jgi:hypothetical protein